MLCSFIPKSLEGLEMIYNKNSDNKVGKKYYVDNPIIDNSNILTKLAIVTGIDKSLLISIYLINQHLL